MTTKLAWDAEALAAAQAYRNHDPELSAAFDRVLDELRASGSVRGATFVGASVSSHVGSVFVQGYTEHVIVWIRQADDRPRITYM